MELTITLEDGLVEKLKKRSSEGNFNDIGEYISLVLKELVDKLEPEPMSEENEEKVKARLQSLGYLD